METITAILHVLEYLFLAVIGVQVCYLFIYAWASIFKYKPRIHIEHEQPLNKVAVIIPGYKEDRIIVDTAKDALLQDYPKDLYHVLIGADSFAEETLNALKQLDVQVLEVSFENSTKAKSVNKALDALSDKGYQIAVILDSDNLMATDFLQKVNAAYNAGFKVIQGHRTAKNQDQNFSLLDALNEEIGNSIFRKGHRVLGVPSALIGSGMAFDFDYYRDIMADIEDVAGEDKLIELKVLEQRQTIEYLEDALVYDEKVSNAANFSKQRTRWVGVQIYFFKNYFLDGVKQLLTKGNFGYFDKAFQMFLIPKVLLIGLLGLLGVLSLISPLSIYWLFLMLLYAATLLFAVPKRFYNKRLIMALLNIPKAIVFMLLGILKINKSTASKFEVTEKTVNKKD
jgi:cellulose synthase/poly-beta-1,6-N-acetylglucosamine synthase-like glycosyltransferase